LRPPVFLDRDGVINRNRHDYVRRPSHWIPIPGAIDAAARLGRAGHPLVVVTNQSGIARGYYTEEDVELIHRVMSCAFRAAGVRPCGILYCPHHPDDRCRCRKPAPGMVEEARRTLSLPRGGWMVGDAESDMELGRRSGLATILVETGRGAAQLEMILERGLTPPDHVVPSLREAADLILSSG